MSTTIVDLSAIANEILMPQVYEIMQKWDTTPLYRSLNYMEAPAGTKSVSLSVLPKIGDRRTYTVGSGAAVTYDAHELSTVKLNLDKVAYKALTVEDFEEIETNVQFREKLAGQLAKALQRDLNAGALNAIEAVLAAQEDVPTYVSGTDVDIEYTDKADVVAEFERLVSEASGSMDDEGMDGSRFLLMGTDIANMLKLHGTGQNQDRQDLRPAWVTGSLNPILGTTGIPWKWSELGYEIDEDYETETTLLKAFLYEAECALFGIQIQPTFEVFRESDFFGLKMRAACKYGYEEFDLRKLRVIGVRVQGDPLSLGD